MEVLRHDDKGVQYKPALLSIMLKNVKHELGVCVDLKEPASLRRDGRNKTGPNLLRSEDHREIIQKARG
jgi:hypothetical protein